MICKFQITMSNVDAVTITNKRQPMLLPFKPGAITEWQELVLGNDRMSLVLEDINKFCDKYDIVPSKKDVFNMFRMLYPHEVKVVIVTQSPYTDCCPSTQVPYACGPALLPAFRCVTTPVMLQKVIAEACRDLRKNITVSPKDLVLYWISQGVMLLSVSLTFGKNCPKYLEDHSVTWEEVMHDILHTISAKIDPIFLLIGKDTWKFENDIKHGRVIKVSHPTANKSTDTPWIGSSVFSAMSIMMIENGNTPIKWII
jgi:uracil DNA glycosylase